MKIRDDSLNAFRTSGPFPRGGRKAQEDSPLGTSGAPASPPSLSGPLTGTDPRKWARECEANAPRQSLVHGDVDGDWRSHLFP